MTRRLTQKQETFCLKYFELGNASEAARIALYSPHTAAAIGRENLLKPKIQQRIDELRQIAQDATVATVLERKQILTEIARGRLADFVEVGADGAWFNIDKDTLNSRALALATSKTIVGKDGADDAVIIRVGLHNPIPAIAELNKMDGIYPKMEAAFGHEFQVEVDAKGKLVRILSRLAIRAGEAEGDREPKPEGS